MKQTNMSLRDSIALELVKTFINKEEPKVVNEEVFLEYSLQVVRGAYGYADAMLFVREENQ